MHGAHKIAISRSLAQLYGSYRHTARYKRPLRSHWVSAMLEVLAYVTMARFKCVKIKGMLSAR